MCLNMEPSGLSRGLKMPRCQDGMTRPGHANHSSIPRSCMLKLDWAVFCGNQCQS